MAYDRHDTLAQKISKLGAWALGAAAFLTVGWMSMRPSDPLGAVSVLGRANSMGMLLQAAVLAGAVAALATLLAGRIRTDAGTFAVALGLGAVSLKGGTSTRLLVEHAEASPDYAGELAAKLALESVGWLAVIIVALIVAAVVARWCFAGTGQDEDSSRATEAVPPLMAACDIPRLGTRLFGVSAYETTSMGDGIRHTVITAVIGLIVLNVLAGGLVSRAVHHGQACFVVAAAVYAACYIAHRLVSVKSAFWSILAVELIALGGYAWAAIRPAAHGLPATVSPSPFLGVLPIQYVAVGTAAALAVFWQTGHHPEHGKAAGREAAGRSAARGRNR